MVIPGNETGNAGAVSGRFGGVPAQGGWETLFNAAFKDSRNAMVLLDANRRIVDVNGATLTLLGHRRARMLGRPVYDFVVGGPAVPPSEWQKMLREGRAAGEAAMRSADGSSVGVQWAATVEVITGSRRVLLVAMSTSRWGRRFRREVDGDRPNGGLSARERDIVRLVALGSTGPEIADELHIAHDTVRTHVRNAMAKTGARSRAHLVAKALGEGLVIDVASSMIGATATPER